MAEDVRRGKVHVNMSTYPVSYDSHVNLYDVEDGIHYYEAKHHNALKDAIMALQQVVGLSVGYNFEAANANIQSHVGSPPADSHHTKYALTDDLASTEITAIQNINTVTIINSQWVYLGELDQGLTTASNVTFGTIAGTSFGGITSANLLDKTAAESITGVYSFGAVQVNFANGTIYKVEADGDAFFKDIYSTNIIYTDHVELGDWVPAATYAFFGNRNLDQTVGGNYALVQSADGTTYLNAVTGKLINFRINNDVSTMSMSASGLQIGSDARITEFDTAALANSDTKVPTNTTVKEYVDLRLLISEIDDTPVDAVTTAPISSNWAFDHAASPANINHLTDAQVAALHTKYALTEDLAAGEITQLQAIGATTISAGQWGVLGGLAATLTNTELNYVDGVTSAIQTQLTGKAPLSHTMASHSDETTYNISTSGTYAFGAAAEDLDLGGFDLTGVTQIRTGPTSDYNKLMVYNDPANYGIGMVSAITYGYLNDWSMTFRMSATAARGFWWGDSSDSKAQGAMSLTTDGRLFVGIRVAAPEFCATADAQHRIIMDPTPNQMWIYPGDDVADEHFIFMSDEGAGARGYPKMWPSIAGSGNLGAGYIGTATNWLHAVYSRYHYYKTPPLVFDTLDDLALLDGCGVDEEGRMTGLEFIQNEDGFYQMGDIEGFALGSIKQLHQKVKDQQIVIEQLATEVAILKGIS